MAASAVKVVRCPGMPQPVFDRQDRFDPIGETVLPGEYVIAVQHPIGTGTGFIGVTSLRVVVRQLLRGKQVALTSLPYSRIGSAWRWGRRPLQPARGRAATAP